MELIHPLVQLDYRSIHWWAIGDHGWCVHHLNTCPSWSPFTAECCWLHYCCWWHTFPTHLALSPCLLGCLSLSFSRFYYSAHYTVYLLPHVACVFVALSLFAASYVLNITNANRLDYGMPLLIEYKSYKWTSKIYNFLAVLFFYRNFSVSNINALWLFALLWYSCHLISIVFSLLCTWCKQQAVPYRPSKRAQITNRSIATANTHTMKKTIFRGVIAKGADNNHDFALFRNTVARQHFCPTCASSQMVADPNEVSTLTPNTFVRQFNSLRFACQHFFLLLFACFSVGGGCFFFLRWRSLRFLFRYE